MSAELSEQNRHNLDQLATFLWDNNPQEQFDMSFVYYRRPHGCHTTACAMGWAPVALGDLKEIEDGKAHEVDGNLDIDSYCFEKFGFDGLDIFSHVWDWIFSGYWDAIDNTPRGAAKRIWFVLLADSLDDIQYGPDAHLTCGEELTSMYAHLTPQHSPFAKRE